MTGPRALGVPLPPRPSTNTPRERMSSTGSGREECLSKPSCMNEVMRMLNERDVGLSKRFEATDNRLDGIDGRLENIERSIQQMDRRLEPVYTFLSKLPQLEAHMASPRRDSTPVVSKGTAEIKTKDLRVRAPVWAALVIAALLVVAVAIWQVEEIAKLFN